MATLIKRKSYTFKEFSNQAAKLKKTGKYGKTNESLNESTPEFYKKVEAWLDYPWQEDREIEFVTLADQYRDKIKSAPDYVTMNYLKELSKKNLTGAEMAMMSDKFLDQLAELSGEKVNANESEEVINDIYFKMIMMNLLDHEIKELEAGEQEKDVKLADLKKAKEYIEKTGWNKT